PGGPAEHAARRAVQARKSEDGVERGSIVIPLIKVVVGVVKTAGGHDRATDLGDGAKSWDGCRANAKCSAHECTGDAAGQRPSAYLTPIESVPGRTVIKLMGNVVARPDHRSEGGASRDRTGR